MPVLPETLSPSHARRLALAAQGFNDPRPKATPDRRTLRRVVGRTGLFQIDSVNVLARAHYLPMFSRVGPYPVTLLERAAYERPRSLFEYWGHEASLLPVELQPLLRWRMSDAEHRAWGGLRRLAEERPDLLSGLLHDIQSNGPSTAAQLRDRHEHDRPQRTGPWWDWSDVKLALEFLFWSGEITSARRQGFERVYDVPERVLPASVIATPTPPRDEAQRELLRISARALGVGTAKDLRDYFRLPAPDCKVRMAELVEAGDLIPVAVDGWRQPAFLDPSVTKIPRWVKGSALLCPFDPLIWERGRTQRLFDFHYRIEIYVPAAQRVHGYYVFPYLLDGALVARVDLKADRKGKALLVQGAWSEPGAPPETVDRLSADLRVMAEWLGMRDVVVRQVGSLAAELSAAVTRG